MTILEGGLQLGAPFTTTNGVSPFVNSMRFLPASVAAQPTLVTLAVSALSFWDISTDPTLLRVYDSKGTGRPIIQGMTVSPSGAVAVGRASGDLELYRLTAFTSNAAGPEPFSTIHGVAAAGSNPSFAFSADERWLAVRRADGKVSVWDVAKQESIGSSFAAGGPGSSLLAPDGSFLVVSSDVSTVVWKLDQALWAEKVCLAAGRNLTEAEWTKYFPGREYAVTCDHWPPRPRT